MTPKYEHIKQFLIRRISSGDLGDAVPSENRLAEQFGVSRMTARRALEELEREGMVDRFPGRGSFVRRHPHYTRGFFRVRPFRKWAQDLDVVLTTRVLEAREMPCPDPIAKILQTRDAVCFLRILNSFDGKPVRYAERYIRSVCCPGILETDLEKESIHDLLINRYRLALTRMSQSLTAVGLSSSLARLFLVEPGYPVFFFKRLIFSGDRPISYVEYTMRGEMAFDDTFTPKLDPADFSGPLP